MEINCVPANATTNVAKPTLTMEGNLDFGGAVLCRLAEVDCLVAEADGVSAALDELVVRLLGGIVGVSECL